VARLSWRPAHPIPVKPTCPGELPFRLTCLSWWPACPGGLPILVACSS